MANERPLVLGEWQDLLRSMTKGGKTRVELRDRLFEHGAMRGRAGLLKIGERACTRKHQRRPTRRSLRVLAADRRAGLRLLAGRFLLRLDLLAFEATRHRFGPTP